MTSSRMNPFYTVLLVIFVIGLGALALKSGVPGTPLMPGAKNQSAPEIPTREWRVAGKNAKQAPSAENSAEKSPTTTQAAPVPSEAPAATTTDAPKDAAPATAPAPEAGTQEGWN